MSAEASAIPDAAAAAALLRRLSVASVDPIEISGLDQEAVGQGGRFGPAFTSRGNLVINVSVISRSWPNTASNTVDVNFFDYASLR